MMPTINEAITLGTVAQPLTADMRDAFAGADHGTTFVDDGASVILYSWDDEGNRRMECHCYNGNSYYATKTPYGSWPTMWEAY